ncbi:MAG: hypothetical protein GXP33_09790 [Spirochaetes bacterium]|nr:hypothetical protein [Spirochaetota bacterium]
MKKRSVILLILILCIGFSNLFAEEGKKHPWGLIFNTNDLLLDIKSYQAGVGVKIFLGNSTAARFLGDIFYATNANSFSATFGATFEKHFKQGRVSPYWGGFLDAGFISQKSEIINPDNWTRNISYPISSGGVFGVEFFILDFLSVFAEYNLSFTGTITSSTISVDGEETSTNPELTYSIDSGIGNNSSLGIVIYMDDVITIKKSGHEKKGSTE